MLSVPGGANINNARAQNFTSMPPHLFYSKILFILFRKMGLEENEETLTRPRIHVGRDVTFLIMITLTKMITVISIIVL